MGSKGGGIFKRGPNREARGLKVSQLLHFLNRNKVLLVLIFLANRNLIFFFGYRTFCRFSVNFQSS